MKTGFVTNNAREVADAIERMYHQPELFQKLSAQTAASVKQICSLETIVTKELNVIE